MNSKAKQIVDSLLGEDSQLFSSFASWKENAEHQGLTVRTGTHPNGNVDSYSTAKDGEGNERGHFDHETQKGQLSESEVDTTQLRDLIILANNTHAAPGDRRNALHKLWVAGVTDVHGYLIYPNPNPAVDKLLNSFQTLPRFNY